MFSSPTAWHELYGVQPRTKNSNVRPTGVLADYQKPASSSTNDLAGREQETQFGSSRGTAETSPYERTSFGNAALCQNGCRVGHQAPRQPFASFLDIPYTVASQPVRVFPPPPSTAWTQSSPVTQLPWATEERPCIRPPINYVGYPTCAATTFHVLNDAQGPGPGRGNASWRQGVSAGGSGAPYALQSNGACQTTCTELERGGQINDTECMLEREPYAQRGMARPGGSSELCSPTYPNNMHQVQQSRQTNESSYCRPQVIVAGSNDYNSNNQYSFTYQGDGAIAGTSGTVPAAGAAPSYSSSGNQSHLLKAVPSDAYNSATPSPLYEADFASPPIPQCLSISDGAHHLNSVPHRSAAAASAVLLFNSSGPLQSSTGCAGGGIVSRHELIRRGARGNGGKQFDHRLHKNGEGGCQQHSPLSSTSMMSSTTAAVTSSESCCVAAVVFNNAKEVGVALCDLPSLTISLLQYADTAVFFKTTSLLHSRNPVEVLVPSTVAETEFVQILLRQHGAHMTFTSVQRCFYHTEAGVQRLSQLKSSEEAALCISDTDRYLCVAAANALILYMEHVNDMQLLPGSVRVRAEALEHFMEVSRTTARALQIIADGSGGVGLLSGSEPACAPTVDGTVQLATSRRRPRGSHVILAVAAPLASASSCPGVGISDERTTATTTNTTLRAQALVDVIPQACTIMGQRYLRRTLLQPLRDRTAVQGRHDAVEWFLCEPRRLHTLRALLRHTVVLDLERLTAMLTLQPRRARTEAQKESYLESLLLLWGALPYLERLHSQLSLFLGPSVDGADNTSSSSSFSVSESSNGEQGHEDEPAPHNRKSAELLTGIAASTPAYPSVLHSVAATLRQCRFTELNALIGRYLERSVLPAVVEHYEKNGLTSNIQNRKGGPDQSRLAHSSTENTSASSLAAVRRLPTQRAATSTLLRVLRMCFLVQAPRGGELDALRTRLSQRIAGITTYVEEMRRQWRLHSLRLEPDPVKLYCFSYLSVEEAKARAVPFTWRYAGGSHFALYLAALREQQQQRQQQQQRFGSAFVDPVDGETVRESDDAFGRRRSSLNPANASSFNMDCSIRNHPCLQQQECSENSRSSFLPLKSSRVTEPWSFAAERPAEANLLPSAQFNASCDNRRHRHRRVRCGTEKLEYYCLRTQECVTAILDQQMRSVQPLVQSIRHDFLGALQATVESVALLDMLLSFALYSLTHHCTRPVLIELNTGLTTAPGLQKWEGTAQQTSHGKNDKPSDCNEHNGGASEDDELTSLCAADTSISVLEPNTAGMLSTNATQSIVINEDGCGSEEDESARKQRVPLFVKGAFHPSVGVSSSALSSNLCYSTPFPSSRSSTFPFQTPQMLSQRSMRDGLCLSWGTRGEVCVITGPNACGKTTLLRILGQHIALAQAGCFVPARQAQLHLADRLFAHMLCNELPSVLYSSFKRELMELNEITHAATQESVVLIDELGRSTTTAQGFSLAWATALFLSDRRVHTVLTTHFAGLPSLMKVRPGRVVAYHFRVSFAQHEGRGSLEQRQPRQQQQQWRRPYSGRTADTIATPALPVGDVQSDNLAASAGPRVTIVRFGHQLFPGPCPQRWYGLAMAERMSFFEPVLALARHTRDCSFDVINKENTNCEFGEEERA